MQVYATIDTNVLVSALYKSDSKPAKILMLIQDGTIIPLLHADIISEYIEVLSRKKFNFDTHIVIEVIKSIIQHGKMIDEIIEAMADTVSDPDDAIFYAITMTAKQQFADNAYLVTGNTKHFPIKPYVVTPAEMVEIIQERL